MADSDLEISAVEFDAGDEDPGSLGQRSIDQMMGSLLDDRKASTSEAKLLKDNKSSKQQEKKLQLMWNRFKVFDRDTLRKE